MGTEKLSVLKLVAIVVVATVAVVGALLFFMNRDKEEVVPKEFSLSAADKSELAQLAEGFVVSNTTFGIDTSKVTGNNMSDVSYLVGSHSPAGDDYFVSRSNAYENTKKFLSSNSQLRVDERRVASWTSDNEREYLASLKGDNVSSEVGDHGFYTAVYGPDTQTVRFVSRFDSRVLVRRESAGDSSWDGSYLVLAQDFTNIGVSITAVKDPEGEWKVYDMSYKDGAEPFLFSTWTNPDKGYIDQLDTHSVDPLVPDKKPIGETPKNQSTSAPEED